MDVDAFFAYRTNERQHHPNGLPRSLPESVARETRSLLLSQSDQSLRFQYSVPILLSSSYQIIGLKERCKVYLKSRTQFKLSLDQNRKRGFLTKDKRRIQR